MYPIERSQSSVCVRATKTYCWDEGRNGRRREAGKLRTGNRACSGPSRAVRASVGKLEDSEPGQEWRQMRN